MAYEFKKLFGPRPGDDKHKTFALIEAPDGRGTTLVGDAETTRMGGDGVADAAPPLGAPPKPRNHADEAAAQRDRVVARLLDREIVTVGHVREAFNQWRRKGEQDALWRWVAQHPRVNREAVYAEAADIYAFQKEEIDPDAVDGDFVQRVVKG